MGSRIIDYPDTCSPDRQEINLLYSALKSGIINIDDVQKQMNEKRREEILKQHPYDIWQGKDGRYRTYVADESKTSGRRMIVKTQKDDLVKYLDKFYTALDDTTHLKNISLKKFYPMWKEYKTLHTNAENYIRRINDDWEKYYLNSDIITIPICKLDKLTLDNWVHKLIKQYKMTKKQYYNVTIIMRQALDYAVDCKIIKENPFRLVKVDGKRLFQPVKKKADNTQVYLKNEIPMIYEMAWKHFFSPNRLKNKLAPLALLFQFQTGIRLGELCVISYADIEGNYLHVQRMYRYETYEIIEHTKNYEDRKVWLTEKAREIIQTARNFQMENRLPTDGYIFSENNKPLSPWSVSYLYIKYCEDLGIIKKSSHKSRKTYISALIDGRVNMNTIREMVGHADERTTYASYCFDRCTESEKTDLIEQALSC